MSSGNHSTAPVAKQRQRRQRLDPEQHLLAAVETTRLGEPLFVVDRVLVRVFQPRLVVGVELHVAGPASKHRP